MSIKIQTIVPDVRLLSCDDCKVVLKHHFNKEVKYDEAVVYAAACFVCPPANFVRSPFFFGCTLGEFVAANWAALTEQLKGPVVDRQAFVNTVIVDANIPNYSPTSEQDSI